MGLEVWREIRTEYKGKVITGSFKFLDGKVNVRTLHGTMTAQLANGGQTPEQLAKRILCELAREGKA